MSDLAVKATLTADGSGLVTAGNQGVQVLKNLRDAAKDVNAASAGAAAGPQSIGEAIGKSAPLVSAMGKTIGDVIGKTSQWLNTSKDTGSGLELNNRQVTELTYSARHLFEQIGTGTPVTTILTSQIGHLSAAFNSGEQISGLFGAALQSTWTWAGLAAGAILAAASAAYTYDQDVRNLHNNLAGSGNPFALTAQQADDAAASIADSAKTTISEGRSIAATFNNANIDPRLWNDAAKAARGYSDAFGVDFDDAIKLFATNIGKPAQGIDQLNEQLHLTTGAQAEHIKELSAAADQYPAQEALVEALGKRFFNLAGNIGGAKSTLRDFINFFKDAWSDDIGKGVAGAAGGAPTVTQTSTSQKVSEDLQRSADAADSYGAHVRDLKADIAAANAEIGTGTLRGADLANAHRILTGATTQLQLAEHAHAQQLLALNPLEQERQQRIKSLIASSDERINQAKDEATASERMAQVANGSTEAQQHLSDVLAIQRAVLPEVTALTWAHGDAADKLRAIIDAVTAAMQRQQKADHGADAVRDVRQQITQLGNFPSLGALDAALSMNVENLDDWKRTTEDALKTAGLYNQQYADKIALIYDGKLAQLMDDDLDRRRDWASGTQRALRDISRSQEDWAATSDNLTRGASQEFENDFVDAILRGKDPLQAFFDWYIEQLLRVIYQQKLASSFNGLAGGLTDLVGKAFGLGSGSKTGTVSVNENVPMFDDLGDGSGIALHNGGAVGMGGAFRSFDTRIFAGAPRFHKGTIPGLNVGESAAILKNDEHVSTAEQYEALTARPKVIYMPSAANDGGGPKINVSVVNRSGQQLQGKQGNATKGSDGSWNVEVLLDQVDKGMAGRILNGNSQTGNAMEQVYGARRKPS